VCASRDIVRERKERRVEVYPLHYHEHIAPFLALGGYEIGLKLFLIFGGTATANGTLTTALITATIGL
jgi:hypothetical protein